MDPPLRMRGLEPVLRPLPHRLLANYLTPEGVRFYDRSLALYRRLTTSAPLCSACRQASAGLNPSFLPVPVISERLDDAGARVHEFPVQFLDHIAMVEYYLWHERACLQVSPPFALEQIAFSAHQGPTCQRLDQTRHAPDDTPAGHLHPIGRPPDDQGTAGSGELPGR